MVFLIILTPPLVILSIVWTIILVQVGRRRRLLLTGVAAPATILHIRTTTGRVGMLPVAALTLQVAPPGAPPFQTVVKQTVSPVNAGRFQPGNTVMVKYDPGNLRRVVLVPGPF